MPAQSRMAKLEAPRTAAFRERERESTFLGVPIVRNIVFRGLYWGSLVLGNYHMYIHRETERERQCEGAQSSRPSKKLMCALSRLGHGFRVYATDV